MSTGEMIFYCGLGLLGATVLLAIVFWIAKPKYTPENVTYEGGSQGTQRLRNGYPTDPLTIRKDFPAEPAGYDSSLPQDEVNAKSSSDIQPAPETTPIQGAGSVGTVALQNETEEEVKGTVALSAASNTASTNKSSESEQQTALL